MKRKILFCVLLSSIANDALAVNEFSSPASPSSYFQGFYLGVGAGGVLGDVKTTVFTGSPPEDPPYLIGNSGRFNSSNPTMIGTAILGYGKRFYPMYFGGEFFGNFGQYRTASYIDCIEIDPTGSLSAYARAQLRKRAWGLDSRLGIFPAPNTLIYGRVGIAMDGIKIKSHSTASEEGSGGPPVALDHVRQLSKRGLRLGVGLEQMLTNALSIRGDYIFTNYRIITGKWVTITEFFGEIDDRVKMNFRTHTISATLTYYMG